MQKKVQTNEERHFSVNALIRKAVEKEERKVVHTGTKLNWSVPHHLSKYHNLMTNQPTDFYWIKSNIAN